MVKFNYFCIDLETIVEESRHESYTQEEIKQKTSPAELVDHIKNNLRLLSQPTKNNKKINSI